MPTQRDYYDILSVQRSATDDEIKKAYRKLARKFHPDLNKSDPSAETRFKEVQEAYDILSDSKKRTAYDQFGHAGVSSAAAADAAAAAAAAGRSRPSGAPGGFRYSTATPGGATVDFGEVNLNDIFESFMGGRPSAGNARGRSRRTANPFGEAPPVEAPRGADLLYPVTITFDQAIHGTTVEVRLNSEDRSIDETISVKIPPGVDEGSKIRVPDRGHPGAGGRGHLLIETHIIPHAYFTRHGKDITLDLPISVGEAANGATVSVPTLDGPVQLRIPPGLAAGKKMRVKEKGVPQRDGTRGDQFCRILIQLPPDLTDADKLALSELDKRTQFNPRKDVGW